jgi:hypothetical protein
LATLGLKRQFQVGMKASIATAQIKKLADGKVEVGVFAA